MSEISEREVHSAGRLDAFVDAAFAFSVTLLIIATAQPPVNLDDLRAALGRIPASAFAFMLIMVFWIGHRAFGKLTARRDFTVTVLSLAIVFTVLVYVYPLRLLTESALYWMSGGRLPGVGIVSSFEELGELYVVYGAGFALLAGLYAALFGHGARRAAQLGIVGKSLDEARSFTAIWVILVIVGATSALLAAFGPLRAAPWLPGFTYGAIPILITVWSTTFGRKRAPKDAA
jgi:uncharacterized membrane protein